MSKSGRVRAVLVLCIFICVGGQAWALQLPDPNTETLYNIVDPVSGNYMPVANAFGDFWSYSLPLLALAEDLENGGGTGPGNPYYVASGPGQIKEYIVVATKDNRRNLPNPYPDLAGMDDAYETPNATGTTQYNTAHASDPGGAGEFGGDLADTWDIQLSALDSYLVEGCSPIFIFNNNETDSALDQNLLAWAQMRVVDLDPETSLPTLYFDFTRSNDLPPGGAWPQVADQVLPEEYNSPGPANTDWPFDHASGYNPGDFPQGAIDMPPSEPLMDIALSGGGVPVYYYTGPGLGEGSLSDVTINHNLGQNQAVYANWSPEFDAILNGVYMFNGSSLPYSGYDVAQIDFRFSGITNGYEQIFILCGTITDGPPPSVPEPGTMALLGTGLIGLAALGRKRFGR
jgi:hypothetical protein